MPWILQGCIYISREPPTLPASKHVLQRLVRTSLTFPDYRGMLWRSQGHISISGDPLAFPASRDVPLILLGGTSLEAGKARQAPLGPQGPNPVYRFPGHTGLGTLKLAW